MINYNQHPSQEDNVAINQRFEGQIFPDARTVDGEQVLTEMLRVTLNKEDNVVIAPDAEAPMLGDFAGAPIVANLELGGQVSGRPNKAFVVRVTPGTESKQLASLLSDAKEIKAIEDDPYYVVLMGDSTNSGFTVVSPTTKTGNFGRYQNNLDWFKPTGKHYEGGHNAEVIPDKEVSRHQLVLSYDQTGGLRVTGVSENSPTVVVTKATEEHKRIVEENIAAKATAVEQVPGSNTVGRQISGLLSRRRKTI